MSAENENLKALVRKIRTICETGIADDGLVLLNADEVLRIVQAIGQSGETGAEPTLESFDMRASYDAAKGLEATATFKGDAVKEWCKIAVDWFRETGGKNFVVMDMTDPRDGEHYTLTVQRAGGKTAAQEIGELKAQLAALQPETSASQTFDEWYSGIYMRRGFVSSKNELQEAWNAARASEKASGERP
jgi:hypothetical protein